MLQAVLKQLNGFMSSLGWRLATGYPRNIALKWGPYLLTAQGRSFDVAFAKLLRLLVIITYIS